MKPIVVLSAQVEDGDDKFSLKHAYTDALIHSDAIPLICAVTSNEEYINEVVEKSHGLFLTGGDDVLPSLYGEEKSDKCGQVCRLRDELELKLIRLAADKGMPVLAVCRGIQLMNVAFGGSLHQHIECHSQSLKKNEASHTVIISGRLSGIYPESARVNSFHHQAIKTLAPGFSVCALSNDGYVEAISKNDTDFFVGVQWHPEHMFKTDPCAEKLFKEFVAACKKYGKKGE